MDLWIDEWINDLDASSEDEHFSERQSPILTYTYRNHSAKFDDDPSHALELVSALLEIVQNQPIQAKLEQPEEVKFQHLDNEMDGRLKLYCVF